jgi:hypothetical protein
LASQSVFSRRQLWGAAWGGAVVFGLAPPFASAQVRPGVPNISARDLNGRPFGFPRDVVGDPALALFTYRREEGAEASRVRSLVASMAASYPRLVLTEFPVIDVPAPVRALIDNGMRSGVPDVAARARVVTLYVPNMARWREATGFSNPRGVWLVRFNSGVMVASAASSAIRTSTDVRRLIDG